VNISDAADAIIAMLPATVAEFDKATREDERNQRKGYYHDLSSETNAPAAFMFHQFLVYADGRVIIQWEHAFLEDPDFICGCNADDAFKAWKSSDAQGKIKQLLENCNLLQYKMDRIPPTAGSGDYFVRYAVGELVAVEGHPGEIGAVFTATGKHGTCVSIGKPGRQGRMTANFPTDKLRRLGAREVNAMWDVVGEKRSASRIGTINLNIDGASEHADIYRDSNGMLILIPLGWMQQCAQTDDDGKVCILDAFGPAQIADVVTLDGPEDLAEIKVEIIEDKNHAKKETARHKNQVFEENSIPF